MIRLFLSSAFLVFAGAVHAQPAKSVPELAGLDRIYPTLDALYQDLHRNPELSKHEDKTAAKLAARLRELGFEVTEHVGAPASSAFFATAMAPPSSAPTWMRCRSRRIPGFRMRAR
jgi:hypothetical protein